MGKVHLESFDHMKIYNLKKLPQKWQKVKS